MLFDYFSGFYYLFGIWDVVCGEEMYIGVGVILLVEVYLEDVEVF